MVASTSTIEEVTKILMQELGRAKAKSILKLLLKVPGNKSFTDTIALIYSNI